MKQRISVKQDLYSKSEEKMKQDIQKMIEFAKTKEGEAYFKNQLKKGKDKK